MNPEKVIGNNHQDTGHTFPLSPNQEDPAAFQNSTTEIFLPQKRKRGYFSKKQAYDYAIIAIAALSIAMAIAYKAKSVFLERKNSPSTMIDFVFR